MSKHKKPVALDLTQETPLSGETEAYFAKCQEKLGLVPNVLTAYSFNQDKFDAFMLPLTTAFESLGAVLAAGGYNSEEVTFYQITSCY